MSALTLAHALAFARDGVPMLPLHWPTANGCSCGRPCGSVGKHPLTPNGVHDASTDPGVIRGWLRRWPNMNLGARCGTPDGMFGLDLDTLEAELWLTELAGGDLVDDLTTTLGSGLEVRTGRGSHLLFRVPAGVTIRSSASKLAPGLDVRGAGGYVVVPDSRHASGRRYAFAGGALTLPPAFLLELLVGRESAREMPGPHQPSPRMTTDATTPYGRGVLERRCDAVRDAAQGDRNYALLRAATTVGGYMATGEINEDDAREALTEAARDAATDSEHPPLGELEIARTIASGFKRGLATPLHRPPSRIERFLDAASDGELEAVMRDG